MVFIESRLLTKEDGMRGIVLAGGSGSRLHPLTLGVSKQLLPVYDKPAIFYPISVLMLAGIREILIISTPRDLPLIQNLLGDGSRLGVHFEYKVQQSPRGIAEAFLVGESFIAGHEVALILGDNFFFGNSLQNGLNEGAKLKSGALVFAHHVTEPQNFGVIEIDAQKNPIGIEEKPLKPKSNWVVTGLYFYDRNVLGIAKALKPSSRGELEITDINKVYLDGKQLKVNFLGRGIAWLDAGTPDSLLETSQFVQTIEKRQGFKIACLEEIALVRNFITADQFSTLAKNYSKCVYGDYLRSIAGNLEALSS